MPIPKTELNKRAREARIKSGLVEVRVWVSPSRVDAVKKMDERNLSAGKSV